MDPAADERPPGAPRWRIGTGVVIVLCGAMFAVSAQQSGGMDLRAGRLTDLSSVVSAERERTNALTDRVAELNADIEALTSRVGDRSVSEAQDKIEVLTDPAGLTPRTGPAVEVTLTDAPEEVRALWEGNPNDLVVHQQDIQAVANAFWRAGATAVTIQGQRIVSTTGIKCEGSTVTLQGVPYAPPYVIVGIGDQAAMHAALATEQRLDTYRDYAHAPGGGVGWEVEDLEEATAPAYEGLLDISWADPIEG